MADFAVFYCPSCKSPSHPASGCAYTPTMVVCGRCTRDAWKWIEKHSKTAKRVGKSKKFVPFYT